MKCQHLDNTLPQLDSIDPEFSKGIFKPISSASQLALNLCLSNRISNGLLVMRKTLFADNNGTKCCKTVNYSLLALIYVTHSRSVG